MITGGKPCPSLTNDKGIDFNVRSLEVNLCPSFTNDKVIDFNVQSLDVNFAHHLQIIREYI